MTTNNDHIKEKLDDYLVGKGIDIRKNFNCLNPTHKDKNPSMSYDKKRNKVHCFSCGADYDIFDLIGIDYNIASYPERIKKACELYGIHENQNQFETKRNNGGQMNTKQSSTFDFARYFRECKDRIKDTNYFQKRGLSNQTIDLYNLGYDPNFTYGTGDNSWKAVIIPTGSNTFVARNTDPLASSERIRKRGGSLLFNDRALEAEKPVFVVEGEIDALSFIEIGFEAVGLGSTSNGGKLVNALKRRKSNSPIILALDNDEGGQNAAKALEKEIKSMGISCVTENIYGSFKDANEALVKDKSSFKGRAEAVEAEMINILEGEMDAEKKEYLNTSAFAHINGFIGSISDSVNTPRIATGFKILDEKLDGGCYEGLYTLGAVTSLGKTTLLLQIADQVAEQGRDVLIFSLEMSRYELMAKSISRLTLINAMAKGEGVRLAKTTRGILDGSRHAEYSDKERNLIETAVQSYAKYSKNIYIHEGIGNIGVVQIGRTIEKHIRITKKRPLVIIDYLQILAPNDPRSSDKQNADKNILELKRLGRDHKISIWCISSFNRASYEAAANISAYKESGNIEYNSDVLMGLQFKGVGKEVNGKILTTDEAKQKDPRKIELKILKQRNGKSGEVVSLEYYPAYNYFKEEE